MYIHSDKKSGKAKAAMFYKVAIALLAVVLVNTAIPLQAEPEKSKAEPPAKPKAKVDKAADEANNNLNSLFFVLGASRNKIADIVLKSNVEDIRMSLFPKSGVSDKYFYRKHFFCIREEKVQEFGGHVSFNKKNRQEIRDMYRQIMGKGKVVLIKLGGIENTEVVRVSTTSGIVYITMEDPESKEDSWSVVVQYLQYLRKYMPPGYFEDEKSPEKASGKSKKAPAKTEAKTTTKELAKILKMPIALGATKAECRKIIATGDFKIQIATPSHLTNLKLYLSKDKYLPIAMITYDFGKDGVINKATGCIAKLKINKRNEEALKALIQQIKTYEKRRLSSDDRLRVVVPQPYLEGKKAKLTFGPLPTFDKKHKNKYPFMTIYVK